MTMVAEPLKLMPDREVTMTQEAIMFRVHGTPRPQPRPRVIRGRAVSTADPKARLWRHAIWQEIQRTVTLRPARAPLWHGPLAIEMTFIFKPPPNSPDRIGQAHTHRPDGDNLAKAAIDVMQDANIFTDDSQVAELKVTKLWGEKPGVIVHVRPMAAQRAAPVDFGGLQPPSWLSA